MFRYKANHKTRRTSAFARLFTMLALVAVCMATTGCGGGGTVIIQQPPPAAAPLPPTAGSTVTSVPPTTVTTTTTTTTVPTTTTAVVPTPLAQPLPPLFDPNQTPPGLTPPPTTFPPFPPGGVLVIKKKVTREVTIIRPIGTGQWQTPPVDANGNPLPIDPSNPWNPLANPGQLQPGQVGQPGPAPFVPFGTPTGTIPATGAQGAAGAPGQVLPGAPGGPVVETTVTVVRDPAQLQGALNQK